MKRIKRFIGKIYKSDLLLALAINIATVVITLILCVPKYEVSDDFIMENILSGAFGKQPNPHIPFVNIIIGYCLVPFYNLLQGISWYFIFLLLVSFISFIAMTWLVLRRAKRGIGLVLSFLLITFFIDDLYILPQFTKTSMFAIMVGSVLFIDGVFTSRKIVEKIVGALLCVIGAMLRFSCLYLAGTFVVFILVNEFIKMVKKSKKAPWVKILFQGILLCTVILTLEIVNEKIYESEEEYAYYLKYSQARSKVVDYEDYGYEAYEKELQSLGVSYNDYMMMKTWNFADDSYFTLELMEQVGDIIVEYQKNNPIGFRQMIEAMQVRKIVGYPVFLACVILGLLTVIYNTKKTWAVFAISFIGFLLYMLLYYRNRVIYRVEFCIFVGVFLSIIYIWGDTKHVHKSYKSEKRIFLTLILVFLIRKVPLIIPDNTYKSVGEDERKSYVDNVFYQSWDFDARKYRRGVWKNVPENSLHNKISHDENLFYFLNFSTTIQSLFYDYSPFKSLPVGYYENCSYFTGITINYPDINNLLDEKGISNPMKSLLDTNVYLVDNDHIDFKVEYLREHYDVEVNAIYIESVEGYQIWKIEEMREQDVL